MQLAVGTTDLPALVGNKVGLAVRLNLPASITTDWDLKLQISSLDPVQQVSKEGKTRPLPDFCSTVQNSSLALCSPRIEKLELVQFTTAEITNSTQPQLSYTDSLLTGAEYNFGQLVTLAPNLAANLTNPAIEVTIRINRWRCTI